MLELLVTLLMGYGLVVAPDVDGEFKVRLADCAHPATQAERQVCRASRR